MININKVSNIARSIRLVPSVKLVSAMSTVFLFTAALAQTPGPALNPQEKLITDTAIHADYKTYTDAQEAIKLLNDSGKHRMTTYAMSKAQCWLDVSFHEYTRNDRSQFPQAALTQSALISQELKDTGQSPTALTTPLLVNASRLRADLWAKIDQLKGQEGFQCVAQQVACAEVELVHAGHEYNQQLGGNSWRHAKPYIQIAEDLLETAQSGLQACVKPPPVVVAVAPTPIPIVVPPPPKVVVKERMQLSAKALFRFDKSQLTDLLPEGQAQINQMVVRLKAVFETIDMIELTGHTDILGSATRNDKLSQERADTIKDYMKSLGVQSNIQAIGKGSKEPVAECARTKSFSVLTACLQPNRRVEVTVSGVKKP